MINILYVSNLECSSPVGMFYDHFIRWSMGALSEKDFSFRLICREGTFNENKISHLLDRLKPIALTDNEINYIFRNSDYSPNMLIRDINIGLCNEYQKRRFSAVVLQKLGSFVPDIIITNIYFNTLLSSTFPQALIFVQDNSIFARAPFERAVCYDPFSMWKNSFLNIYAKELKSYTVSQENDEKLENFKKEFQNVCLSSTNPLTLELIKNARSCFRKMVLLPLSGIWTGLAMDGFAGKPYKNDFDLVEYVMSNTPKDIGVFVTEHDFLGTLTKDDVAYFRAKYSNFICYKNFDRQIVCASSLDYYPFVDVVLNATSKTGITACFWDKPIVSLSNGFNEATKDFDFSCENICKAVDMEKSVKNNLLYWYLTSYVSYALDYNSTERMTQFFTSKLEKFRKDGITFSFFEPNHNIDEICSYVLLQLKNGITLTQNTLNQKKNEIIEKQNTELQKKLEALTKNLQIQEEKLTYIEEEYKKLSNVSNLELVAENVSSSIKKNKNQSYMSKINQQRIRLLSHITLGKMRKHYKDKWKKIKKGEIK